MAMDAHLRHPDLGRFSWREEDVIVRGIFLIREPVRRGRDEDEEAFMRAQPDPADQEFFISFGNALKQRFPGWRAYVLTSDRKLPGMLRLRESTKTPLFNGAGRSNSPSHSCVA